MTGVQMLAIVMIAASGGAVAYGIWLLIEGVISPAPNATPGTTAANGPSARPPQTAVDPTAPPGPAAMNVVSDPNLGVQIAALSREIAALAQGQAEMMEAQVERENRMLMEIRATAQASDPEVLDSLKRIEGALNLTGAVQTSGDLSGPESTQAGNEPLGPADDLLDTPRRRVINADDNTVTHLSTGRSATPSDGSAPPEPTDLTAARTIRRG
ncbi:MAG: hypothetical protein AAGA19_13550 [Pseudomonadota bacterium]